jgi:hypothetical protein
MAPKDSTILMEILQGQTALTTEVKNLNIRLFGAEGQKGCIPVLFDKTESLSTHIQAVKDEALKGIQETKDVEIGGLRDSVSELKTKATIAMWKTGAISSVAGSGAGIGITMLVRKLLGIH